MSREPPRLAQSLLRLVVPRSEVEVVLGELLEGFRAREATAGLAAARRWYVRVTLGFVLRAASVQAHSRHRRGDRMNWMRELIGDMRWAMRSLGRRPTFAIVVVVTLALGIGANSAIFTLVVAHFFEPLPYERPDELVLMWETRHHSQDVSTVAPGNYFSWREQSESFGDVAAYNVDRATLSGDGLAERVDASVVTPHFFRLLGVTPALGTGFEEDGAAESGTLQVMLSHGLWLRRYGGDPAIVGREIRVDGQPHTVVGVLPSSYRQPERAMTWQSAEVWRPLWLDSRRDDRGSRYLRTIARRRPGVTVEQAREEMTLIGQRLAEQFPEANEGRAVLVRTLDDYLLSAARPTLLMLLAAGVAVLLIVCANVANLILARGEERRSEFAVRAALGSGRARLVRQVMVEGVVLSLAGAAVGASLVFAGGRLLQSLQTRFFSGLIDIVLDWRIVALTVVVAIVAGGLLGLPLARSASRQRLGTSLVEGTRRSAGSARGSVLRNGLIVGQVALATTLLVVAILLSRSFAELVSVPPGFEPSGVVTFSVAPARTNYGEPDSILRYHRELLGEIEGIPGVEEVGMVSDLMFTTENRSTRFTIEGQEVAPEEGHWAEFHIVLPEYFDVLGIPLRRGELPDGWRVGAEVPVVVNQRLAQMYWPGGDALGGRFWFDGERETTFEIVGEVGDVLDDGYQAEEEPIFYIPFAAMPRRGMSYVVRAAGDPAALMTQLRTAVARVDPDVPASELRLLSNMMAETVARPRAAFLIGSLFAVIALLVAAGGIYGVLSYVVQARTREIGIRSALGANAQQLVSMVMAQSGRLILAGLALGTAGAILAGHFLSALLFRVPSWDPFSLTAAALLLGGAGLLASWIPARRAVTIAPTEALRAD